MVDHLSASVHPPGVTNIALKLVTVYKPPSPLSMKGESPPLLGISGKGAYSEGQVSNETIHLLHASPESTFHWVLSEFCQQTRVNNANQKITLYNQDGIYLPLSACVRDYYTPMNSENVIFVFPQEKPRRFRRTMPDAKTCQAWIFLAVLGFLIALSGIVTLVTLAFLGMLNLEHAVVIDAGSSSSKVQLYTWRDRPSSNAAVSQSGDTCRTKRGISESEAAPANSSIAIMNCLQGKPFIDIPSLQAPYVNLYLGATAGMRMLSYSNPNATEAILTNLRSQLQKTQYRMPNPNERIRIITGQEEAIGAWTTVNYLLEKFGKFTGNSFSPQPSPPEETIGSLDLGGASTQITFIPSQSAIAKNDTYDLISLKLFGQVYDIYGHSFLCYGKHESEYRQLAMMLKRQNFSSQTSNPCIAKNVTASYKSKAVFTAPCVNGHFAIQTFGEEILPPPNVPKIFHVIGTGDVETCRKEYVLPFFQTNAFKSVKIPPIRGRFLAFAGYYFVLNHMRLAPTTSLANFSAGVKTLCQTSPSERDHQAAYKEEWYCFDGVYIEELLQAYGFDESNWGNIEFVDKVRGSGVSWSLGFMIDHSGHLKSEMPGFLNTYFSLAVFVVLLLLLTAIMICACVFCIRALRITKEHKGEMSYSQVKAVSETNS